MFSFLLPGGGHFVTGHWFVGSARMMLELAVLFALWSALSGLGRDLGLPFSAATALILFIAFKTEAASTAASFARLGTTETATRRRIWNRGAFLGGVLMAAWAVTAAVFVGHTDRGVLRDLEFHAGDALGWKARYESPVDDDWIPKASAILRSTWTHDDRWELEVLAEPLAKFETPEKWIARVNRDRQAAGQTPGQPFRLGAVDGVYFVDRFGETDDSVVQLRYAAFDRLQRDVHTVQIEVFAFQVEAIDELVRTLLRRGHWTKAGDPCGSKWDVGSIGNGD